MKTNSRYSPSEATAAKVNWPGENSLPGWLVVNAGSTRLNVASVVSVASAAPLPSALNNVTP